MAQIIKVSREKQPEAMFVGKKFDPEKWPVPPAMWGTAFEEGWFETLEKLVPEDWTERFPEGDAYIGLEYTRGLTCDEYWVGMWLPVDTPIPEGFGGLTFPECTLGCAWVQGREETGEIYGMECECMEAFAMRGMLPRMEGVCFWVFERYACPRFTEPDENGNVILDICLIAEE